MPESTRFLVLTVSPAGDTWFNKHPEIKSGRKGDYDHTPRPMGSDPVLVRATGDLVVVYADMGDGRVPEGEVVQVADGVTAQLSDALPVLMPGDAWLRAMNPAEGVRPGPCAFPVDQRWTPGPDPESKDAKKASTDGRALLDMWSWRTGSMRPGPATTRKLALLAYQLGQAVGHGDVPSAFVEGCLDEVFPPEVDLDPEGKLGLAPRRQIWPGTRDQLVAAVKEGARRPAALPKDGSEISRPKRWKLGDDRELGQDLAVKLGGNSADHRRSEGEPLTAVYDRGSVHHCDRVSAVWKVVPDHEIQKLAARYSGTYVASPTDRNPEGAVPVKLSQGRIEAISKVAQMYLTTPGFFDGAPLGIALRGANGPLFLPVGKPASSAIEEGVAEALGDTPPGKVGVAVPLAPEHRVRASQVLDIAYDPDAECPMFADFLDSVFVGLPEDEVRGRQTCLMQLVGAALLGIGPRFEKAGILTGVGANGKSTFLRIISRLFPDEARVAVPMQVFGEDYKRSLFADARINVCNELPARDILASEAVKDIIDGSEVIARLPHRPPFQFRSRATHLFAANRLPPTSDLSRGFFRRFIVVDFPNSFEGREDRGLADRIIASELPGILSLAITAAAILVEQNQFTIPESSRRAEAEWRQHSDSVSMWLHEATEASGWTASSAAHLAYRTWCERALLKPVSTKEFALRLLNAKVKDKAPGGVRHWALTPKRDYMLAVDPVVAELTCRIDTPRVQDVRRST